MCWEAGSKIGKLGTWKAGRPTFGTCAGNMCYEKLDLKLVVQKTAGKLGTWRLAPGKLQTCVRKIKTWEAVNLELHLLEYTGNLGCLKQTAYIAVLNT